MCSVQRAGDFIAKEEIREALKKMANGKAVGPDQIPVEVWKFMGEVGLEWLTELLMLFTGPPRCPES